MPRKVKRKTATKKVGRRRMLHGAGIFGDIGNFFKSAGRTVYDKVLRPAGSEIASRARKPSTWLSLAGMLPTPLSGPLKAAGVVSGLTGNGKRRRKTARHKGRGSASGRMCGSGLAN